MRKRVVVLGGGIGGQVVSNLVRRRASRDTEVTLVDRSDTFSFPPSFLWLVTGERSVEKITRPLSRLERKGIRFIRGAIETVNINERKVIVNGSEIPFDYLVICLGAELNQNGFAGFSEVAHQFYSVDGAMRLREELNRFKGGEILFMISSLPYKCPAAPYECALVTEAILRRRGLREKCKLVFVTPEPFPLPVAGEGVGRIVMGMLEKRGISFLNKRQPVRIDAGGREVELEDGMRIGFDLLIGIPPHRAPRALAGSGLTNEAGWIPVDGRRFEVAECVFAIGDVTANKLKNGTLLPKAGVFAHYQGEVVADAIVRGISGEKSERTFNGEGSCFLEVAPGRAAFATGNFYADPAPAVEVKPPSVFHHWSKVFFEWNWLRTWL